MRSDDALVVAREKGPDMITREELAALLKGGAFEAKVAKAGQQQELDHSTQDSDQKSSLKSSLKTRDRILAAIETTPSITLPELATRLDLSLAGIKKNIRLLQTEGSLRRIGPDKGGHWEVVK